MLKSLRLAVFIVCIAAFASGCGGGGGGSAQAPTTPDPPAMPDPTPQEMCEGDGGRYNADGSCTSAADLAEEMALSGAQEAAMAAYMAAMAAVSGAKDPVAMANAQMYADMAKEASDMAAGATTSGMAGEYQMKAEMNRDMAMEAAMMPGLGITKLANKIVNQDDIDNAVLEGKTGDDVPDPVSNAGRVSDTLEGIRLVTVRNTPAVAGFGEVANGSVSKGRSRTSASAPLTTGARATYSASGPRFTITLPAGPAAQRGETPTSLTTRGGWMGAEFVGINAQFTTYGIAFTDIQPTKTVASYVDPADTPTPITLTDGVTSGVTGDIPGDGSDFEGTYNANIADNQPPVSGLFDCTAANGQCSISVNEDGEIVSIQGYEFRRATGTTTMADGDYLAWGVWVLVHNAPPGPTTPAIAVAYASGSDVFEVRAALTGTAAYNGVATGLYAAGGMVDYFDADVSLTANFGGTDGADSDADTAGNNGLLLGVVTGSVTNIKAGGMAVDGSLTLGKANILSGTDPASPSTTADAPSTTGFIGAASSVTGTLAGRAMRGTWGGQFYGPNKASGNGIRTEYPTTAAGAFDASAPGNTPNDTIRLRGSFGAWKAE